jgi:UDP-2,3-diacylglucosamine hydrolase
VGILFISDLHLSEERPEKLALFFKFMNGPARRGEALYILGDLFEVWLGDDDTLPPKPEVLAALKAYSDSGRELFVTHGNRDFLMGPRFEELTGCTLLPDPHLIDLHGEKTLLMHGDLLCTGDTEYLAFRSQVRHPAWQAQVLSKSLAERAALARQMRNQSLQASQQKQEEIMDVEQATVEQFMRTHGVQHLIHGHTHRPAAHEFVLDNRPAKRIVLGDWYTQESVLVCDGQGQRLMPVSEFITQG